MKNNVANNVKTVQELADRYFKIFKFVSYFW